MVLIPVTRHIAIDSDELIESYARASGPGGQHVNTTDSAVMLRFDVTNSPNLPEAVKLRLAELAGSRLTRDGVPLRVLISYGEFWFPWYMRRLAERPANVLFVAKSLVAR